MLVLRHGHPGGKKKQYYLDLDTPVKPEYDNEEGCFTWIIGSSPIMTDTKTSCSCSYTGIQVGRRSIIVWPGYSSQAGVWQTLKRHARALFLCHVWTLFSYVMSGLFFLCHARALFSYVMLGLDPGIQVWIRNQYLTWILRSSRSMTIRKVVWPDNDRH